MTHSLLLALQASASPGGGMTMLLVQIALIGAVFYFLILRPQGKARKQHAEMLSQLKKNDEVMTAGGVIGKVKDIKDVEMNGTRESRVTIESGTATVVVERSRIVRIGGVAAGRQ